VSQKAFVAGLSSTGHTSGQNIAATSASISVCLPISFASRYSAPIWALNISAECLSLSYALGGMKP
jgi:hypothetical protein